MPIVSGYCWNCCIATLTVGSVFKGVLEIYGTTNKLIYVYPAVSIIMLFIGIVALVRSKDKSKN